MYLFVDNWNNLKSVTFITSSILSVIISICNRSKMSFPPWLLNKRMQYIHDSLPVWTKSTCRFFSSLCLCVDIESFWTVDSWEKLQLFEKLIFLQNSFNKNKSEILDTKKSWNICTLCEVVQAWFDYSHSK